MMPICTTCTHWLPYLYTVYSSAYNLRLEQCPNCHNFADPYVEHDELTLLIDLLLLKRDVYRHLLYNRGQKPRREDGSLRTEEKEKEKASEEVESERSLKDMSRWHLVLRLGLTLTFVDAFIRWSLLSKEHHSDAESLNNSSNSLASSPWAIGTISGFARILVGCCIESTAFHAGVMLACYVVLRTTRSTLFPWLRRSESGSVIRSEFRFSLIPLSLFYSSFTKLFLLFLLTIWRPSRISQHQHQPPPSSSSGGIGGIGDVSSIRFPFNLDFDILEALEFMTDENLDREWIVRNVMGGISAGFGVRG
ncbi:hypothetical protein D9757_012514 [Collybiopsis confluens]|uniref:Protein ARV n=1 Tax=Collybiopsis confluens TaxID=2823264 RepID=A0A8H5D3X8_9AGAR|nr:hypothetical protein D9757_012514 [Collybiopsis confluens]